MHLRFKNVDLLEALGGSIGCVPIYEPGLRGDFGIPRHWEGDTAEHKEFIRQGVRDTNYLDLKPFALVAINPGDNPLPGYQPLNRTLLDLVPKNPPRTPRSVMGVFSSRSSRPTLEWRVQTDAHGPLHKEIQLSRDYSVGLAVADNGIKAMFKKGACHRVVVYNRKSYSFDAAQTDIDEVVEAVAPEIYDALLSSGGTANQKELRFGFVTMVQTANVDVLAHKERKTLAKIGVNQLGGFNFEELVEGFQFQQNSGVVGIRLQTFRFIRQDGKATLLKGPHIRKANRPLNIDPFSEISTRDDGDNEKRDGYKTELASVTLTPPSSRKNSSDET